MEFSATRLRQNLYVILDQALESGETVTVKRGERRLLIVPEQRESKFSRLKRRSITGDNGDSLPDIHWDREWNSGEPDDDLS